MVQYILFVGAFARKVNTTCVESIAAILGLEPGFANYTFEPVPIEVPVTVPTIAYATPVLVV